MDLNEVSALPKPTTSDSCARSRGVQTNLGMTPGRGRRLVSPRFPRRATCLSTQELSPRDLSVEGITGGGRSQHDPYTACCPRLSTGYNDTRARVFLTARRLV